MLAKILINRLFLCLLMFWLLLTTTGLAVDPLQCMPQAKDHTSMWWENGFPSHSPTTPWRRCVRTGFYGLIVDTESLQIPHFGPIDANAKLAGLPAAQLELNIRVQDQDYKAIAGGDWSKHGGPRLIESGRFLQRADVTDIVFKANSGERLNIEARMETAAWPDRLGLILSARPGHKAIEPGETSFGRIGGGFGLDGTNELEIKHRPEYDTEHFTLELWVLPPTDYQASEKTFPWLVCQGPNEQADGNLGIAIINGRPQARLNIGGGRANSFVATAEDTNALKLGQWNHLAISYDGNALRIFVNGRQLGEQSIGRLRTLRSDPITLGRRQDNSGDGYHFKGVIDEIGFYGRALSPAEIRQRFSQPDVLSPKVDPLGHWSFHVGGTASLTFPREPWNLASMEIALQTTTAMLRQRLDLTMDDTRDPDQWHEVSLAIDPIAVQLASNPSEVHVKATEIPSGDERPVEYVASRGWHRINLDGIEPITPNRDNSNFDNNRNDAMERIKLVLSNSSDREQVTRLLFEKTIKGFPPHIGAAITGVSAILRDADGQPTGIPVQLSKNWHNDSQAGVYRGQWFHGISQLRLPAHSTVQLELSIVYGHWGGVAAASHAQLCLIGWGCNQLWDQSALGAWGESICYEPDQVQANCSITDVRPLMVRSLNNGQPWGWTSNVGGGDYFRMFDTSGERIAHTAMTTNYHRQGPCLTEATYAGQLGTNINHSETVSLARTDDLVRGTYRVRMNVQKATEFSRFVIFQIGADTYNSTSERKMAIGDESGLQKEWKTRWNGDTYANDAVRCNGRIPWASLHEAETQRNPGQQGSWANRGLVIRKWNARLGGKQALPWMAEHGTTIHGRQSTTIDIVPPPGVTRFEPGDFVEATIEHIVVPQYASDYYGPNEDLRTALTKNGNTWRMIHREAIKNDRKIKMNVGQREQTYPDIRIRVQNGHADFKLMGGVGYVPITFTNLTSPSNFELIHNDQRVDQSIHGNDFWQTDFDPAKQLWSQTYNIPVTTKEAQSFRFRPIGKSRS